MENMHGGPCFDSSKREFDNLADFLGMDDLLNFSNDDIAGPILGPSFSLTDICIPSCEDVAELEWLSNFVDEESFNYSSFSGQEDSKAAEDYNTSRSITTTNTPSPSPSPSSSSLTSSSASLGNMAMAMTMAGNSSSSSSSSSSSNNNSNTNDGSLQVQTGFPVPGRARSKRPRKEGSASGWVSSSSRSRLTTLSHPEPSSLSHDQPDYYNGEDSTITFLDCSSTSTMAAEATPFLIHFKSSPNTSTKTHQPTQSPPLPKKVNIKLWHNKTNQPISPTSTNSSSSTTTTATATTAGATTTNSYNNNNNNNSTTGEGGQEGQGRKCLHCGSQKTPQWRAGPLGPKTLCNACGVRHKSGRLFPEYRPVASPTFVASVHSNSHRKVMEIRGLKQRTYYHHNAAITTGAITSSNTTAATTTTGTIRTTTCSAPSYSFPSF